MKEILLILFSLSLSISTAAQDSLLISLATENMSLMKPEDGTFAGPGWDLISQQAAESHNVLIGEDHFTREIPLFIEAIGLDSKFDNFYIEIDPFTTDLLEKSFQWSEEKRNSFNEEFSHLFSFYTLKDEYRLLEELVNAGMKLLGSDQIVMYDDRLLFCDLATKTSSLEAKEIYEYVAEQSKVHLQQFLANSGQKPMYMMTPDFDDQLDTLSTLELSPLETEIIDKLRISKACYQAGGHTKRVQLLKHHVMNDYQKWKNKRNLFKYGANHMARGESFLTVRDIGNLVANISEANYEKSLHIMVMGESGEQATAFEFIPPSPIDPNGFYLKHLKPFFQLTEGKDWAVFDLIPLRKALERGQLSVENKNLVRTIKGFDFLVLIPEVSAARFK